MVVSLSICLKMVGNAPVRSRDVIGRVGGDEFLVFLKRLPSTEMIYERCELLVNTFREQIHNPMPEKPVLHEDTLVRQVFHNLYAGTNLDTAIEERPGFVDAGANFCAEIPGRGSVSVSAEAVQC